METTRLLRQQLLAACWGETLDPGPYTLAEGAKRDLGKVLQGDRFVALLLVRARVDAVIAAKAGFAFRGIVALFEQGGSSGAVRQELNRAENAGAKRRTM
jgi:hypothetical protein